MAVEASLEYGRIIIGGHSRRQDINAGQSYDRHLTEEHSNTGSPGWQRTGSHLRSQWAASAREGVRASCYWTVKWPVL